MRLPRWFGENTAGGQNVHIFLVKSFPIAKTKITRDHRHMT
jgi:hypothetical protein